MPLQPVMFNNSVVHVHLVSSCMQCLYSTVIFVNYMYCNISVHAAIVKRLVASPTVASSCQSYPLMIYCTHKYTILWELHVSKKVKVHLCYMYMYNRNEYILRTQQIYIPLSFLLDPLAPSLPLLCCFISSELSTSEGLVSILEPFAPVKKTTLSTRICMENRELVHLNPYLTHCTPQVEDR